MKERPWKVWFNRNIGLWAAGRIKGVAIIYKSKPELCYKFIDKQIAAYHARMKRKSAQEATGTENHVFHQAVS